MGATCTFQLFLLYIRYQIIKHPKRWEFIKLDFIRTIYRYTFPFFSEMCSWLYYRYTVTFLQIIDWLFINSYNSYLIGLGLGILEFWGLLFPMGDSFQGVQENDTPKLQGTCYYLKTHHVSIGLDQRVQFYRPLYKVPPAILFVSTVSSEGKYSMLLLEQRS